MSFNGSGTYTPPGASFPAVAGTTIEASKFNNIINDMATALSTCITKDGQTTVTATIPFGGNVLSGVASGLSARTRAMNTGDYQDGTANYVDGGGTGDAITATFVPAITSVVDGMLVRVRATAANTGAATFSPNGLTARAIVKGTASTALAAGDIVGDGYEMLLTYRSADTTWQLLNPNPATNGPAFLTYDTTNLRLGVNNTSPSVPLHVKTVSPDTAVAFLETTAANGAGTISALTLRASSFATANDALRVSFQFGGSNTTRAAIQGILTGATVGNLNFLTHNGTSLASRAAIVVGMTVGSPTGGDQGAGTINTSGGVFKNGVEVGGKLLRRVTDTDATYGNTTSVIPTDDSIPQVGEGTEILSAAITPANASNIIRGTVVVPMSGAAGLLATVAVFKDGAADAIAVGAASMNALGQTLQTCSFTFEDTAGGTSAITYSVRYGPGTAGTIYVNGDNSSRLFGGISKAVIILDEIAA